MNILGACESCPVCGRNALQTFAFFSWKHNPLVDGREGIEVSCYRCRATADGRDYTEAMRELLNIYYAAG